MTGEAQRHSVLMLVSELVEFIGVPCLLPPLVADHKLLLLVTHLASIEVRLATENSFAEQVCDLLLIINVNVIVKIDKMYKVLG